MAQTELAANLPDYVVEALNDQQRRDIVSHLSSVDGALTLRELGNRLADRDPGSGPSPPSKKLLVKLHHVHLPKLDDAGLVEYAPEKRRVAYAGEWALAAVDDDADALVAGLG